MLCNTNKYSSNLIYGPLIVEWLILQPNLVAWIEVGIRDLDAIASIESAKSDITCNDTYIISCLHFSALSS